MEPQNEKTANSFAEKKVCGNSTNNEIHNGRQGPKADLSTWPDGFKLQGPIDATTTYGVIFMLCRINSQIMEIMKKWFLLPHLMNIQWVSHIKLTVLIEHSLMERPVILQTLPSGIIFIHMEMNSIQTEALSTHKSTLPKLSMKFSNGQITTRG